MTTPNVSHQWAERFGLALTPLFEKKEQFPEGEHQVLLDGGFGSFALSDSTEQLWREQGTAGWAWSSNLPHHITITKKEVAIIRWDKPQAEILSRSSVENQLDTFYDYLIKDRVRSNQGVTDHMMGLFRRIRSLVAEAKIDDANSTDAFLAFLSQLMESNTSLRSDSHNKLSTVKTDILKSLSLSGLQNLRDEISAKNAVNRPLPLLPALAIRHASSEIFQEAHFELLKAPSLDLFGYAGPAETRITTRGGVHFTPPALARSLVEQTLAKIADLSSRNKLTVLDPACGSGAFLHETLRTLRRLNFSGKVILIGKDISQAAISMANFVISNAAADWSPKGGIEIKIEAGDSLEGPLPAADIILMNPPFIAWPALIEKQRDQMKQILGLNLKGRGDISMAFITHAISCLNDKGAIGILFPASLLTLEAADKWRKSLLEEAELSFIASLGDYGLFAHALVQIAAAVFTKDSKNQVKTITTLETLNNAEATGNAFRTLRQLGEKKKDLNEGTWNLFETPTANFVQRATWRPIAPKIENALIRLREMGMSNIGDLFDVKQGIRTGMNQAFVISKNQYLKLPKREQKYFQQAVLNESIKDAKIYSERFVFYPYDKKGLIINTEGELLKLLPVYSEHYLIPNKKALSHRTSITRAKRHDWWGLSERRSSWALNNKPRIISKYFGGLGGIALDLEAAIFVIQGFAWLPKQPQILTNNSADIEYLLSAYTALMNSNYFWRIVELFSPHVAGGQYDLSPRYVNLIPIPNLWDLTTDEHKGQLVSKLGKLGKEPKLNDIDWQGAVDRIVTELYGGNFFD